MSADVNRAMAEKWDLIAAKAEAEQDWEFFTACKKAAQTYRRQAMVTEVLQS